MRATVDSLSDKDKLALIKFFGTDAYYALRKLVEEERLAIAKDHVDQTDIMQVRYLSGQVASLKSLIGTLQYLYKESEKNKKKT